MFRFDSRVRWCLVAGLVACLVVVGGVDQVQAFKQFSSKNKSFIKLWKSSQFSVFKMGQFGRKSAVPKVFSKFFSTKGNGGFANSWLGKQNLQPGQIITIAGTGQREFSGDNGLATSAQLNLPIGVFVSGNSHIFITDRGNYRVRRVTPEGVITTIAGTGQAGFSGDGGLATSAQLNFPAGVFVSDGSHTFITDARNYRVRRVTPEGVITTIAGTGQAGFSGDGGLATSAQLNFPAGVFVSDGSHTVITDTRNHRVRRVTPEGVITTIAGTGQAGFSGDGGLATSAQLNFPAGVFVSDGSHTFITDIWNHRVRRVSPEGVITTIAGNGEGGFGGDGGPAVNAKLCAPTGVFVTPDGHIYIADMDNHRVRRVSPEGLITTIAGNGERGFGGDGGPATNAQLSYPLGVFVTHDGYAYIADMWNHRVRVVKL